MQKKIIALAVAGLASTAAFAQSNVTIYGLLDASGYATTGNNNRATNYGFLSNAVSTSRLGFKGTEDLGNGLKAFFNLETELNLANGQMGSSTSGAGAGNFTRAANVGLDTKLGAITLGRQATPTYAAVGASDVLGSNSGGLTNAWVYTNVNTTATNRISTRGATFTNAAAVLPNGFAAGVGYASPVIAGLQLKAYTNMGNNTADTDFEVGGLRDVALSYSGFGANVRLTHQQVMAASSGRVELKNTLLGADYTIAGVKLAAAYVRTAFDNPINAADVNTATVGASYQLGKTNVGVSYTDTRASNTNDAVKQYAALAKYSLSKRTDAYVTATYAINEGTARMNGLYTANQLNAVAGDAVNASSVAVGVRHSF